MNLDTDLSLSTERTKFAELGIDGNRLADYQILCLPQNIFRFGTADDLHDADGARTLAKLLKASNVRCGTAFDLGLDIPILHMRSSELWFGVLWILDNAALPLLIQAIAPLITAKLNTLMDASPKVHIDLYVKKGGNTTKLSYNGDGETLVRVLKSLE
jgi:hypothetical protein